MHGAVATLKDDELPDLEPCAHYNPATLVTTLTKQEWGCRSLKRVRLANYHGSYNLVCPALGLPALTPQPTIVPLEEFRETNRLQSSYATMSDTMSALQHSDPPLSESAVYRAQVIDAELEHYTIFGE